LWTHSNTLGRSTGKYGSSTLDSISPKSDIRATRGKRRLVYFLLPAGALLLAAATYAAVARPELWTVARTAALEWIAPRSADAPARRPLRVKVVSAVKEDVPIYLTGIGTVQGYNSVAVTSRVDGHIMKVLFTEGQDVAKGDPLVIIDPAPYRAQLDQQVATLEKDQATLTGAQLDLVRYETLLQKNFGTQQQVDQQRALVDQYRAQIKNDQAQINYARAQLDYTSIRAPITGRVGIRQIDEGNVVHAADARPIVVIVQLQPISVIFTLPAGSLAKTGLSIGRVEVPVIALASDGQTELDRGTVELVDNLVDQTSGTIKLRAAFPNKNAKLWPGDFVNGRITVDTRPNAITIPLAGLRHGPRGDYIWTVREDDTVAVVGVTAGQMFQERVLIEKGLTPGQRVVVDGYYGLSNGAKVDVDLPANKAAENR
jgi:multidrug efflux system membrane fusion protein